MPRRVRISYNGVPLNNIIALKLRMKNKFDERQNEILEATAIEVATRMQNRTPVKTGTARSNWSVARDRFNPPFNPAKMGIGNPVDISGLKGIFGQGPITISNPTPYAIDLEFGSSKQAPQGMVRVTLPEIPGIAKLAVLKTRG